jgi:hypothetical protein
MDVVAELEWARVEGEPMALVSTTTSSSGGGPGSGRRGVLAATKGRPSERGRGGVRATPAAALAADRGAAGQGDAVR